jgi:hypothetical protein
MAQLQVNPMDTFRLGGQVNSPAYGIGNAIRGVLDTARKRGLLQAQSQYQSEGANTNAILAEQRKLYDESLPAETLVIGKTKEEDRSVPHLKGQKVLVRSSGVPDDFGQMMGEQLRLSAEKMKNSENTKPKGGIFGWGSTAPATTAPVTTSPTSFVDESALLAAVAAGSIKSGDKVVVGGVPGVYE